MTYSPRQSFMINPLVNFSPPPQAVLEQVGQLLGEQPTPSSTAEERPLVKAARATARHAAGAAKSAATGVAAAAAAAEAVTTGTTPKVPPARVER